jgi:hypothetical protein
MTGDAHEGYRKADSSANVCGTSIPVRGPFFQRLVRRDASILMVLLMGVVAGAGQEQTFNDYNCAITQPTGWILSTNPTPPAGTFVVNISDPGRTRGLVLVIQNEPKPTQPLDSFFVASYERGLQARGGEKPISTRFMEIGGVKAYERVANAVIKGRDATTVWHLIVTDTCVYTVESIRFDGPVLEDSEIQEALASFRFITPPKAPVLSPERAGYEIGYMIGRYGPLVVLGIAVIAGCVFAIIKVSKRNGSTAPPLPPEV